MTDGETNASLPKSLSPQELTFQAALDLLKARAERGPSPAGDASPSAAQGRAEEGHLGGDWGGEAGRQGQGREEEGGAEAEQEEELSATPSQIEDWLALRWTRGRRCQETPRPRPDRSRHSRG